MFVAEPRSDETQINSRGVPVLEDDKSAKDNRAARIAPGRCHHSPPEAG